MISVETEIIPIKHFFKGHYRLAELLAVLDNPQQRIPTINVVGTNGKGSTTMALANNLQKHYKKVGWFTSPAFTYHNERIRINDQMISDKDLLSYLTNYQPLIRQYELTFFEIWTLIMILYFAEQKVDLAIIEAGIGGLKDSTNVMTDQLMVILTSLSLDHTEILGESIAEILAQKLGIVKKDCPVFISADNRPYQDLINHWAQQHPRNTIIWGGEVEDEVDYQKANRGLVVAVFDYLKLSTPEFKHWPLGRFTVLQEKPYRVIIDGAHNEDGLAKLLRTLEKKAIKPSFLFATSSNKNHDRMLKKLLTSGCPVYLTTFDHFKAWNTDATGIDPQLLVSWKDFLQKPLTQDLVISGSIYFVAQVYDWWNKYH